MDEKEKALLMKGVKPERKNIRKRIRKKNKKEDIKGDGKERKLTE